MTESMRHASFDATTWHVTSSISVHAANYRMVWKSQQAGSA